MALSERTIERDEHDHSLECKKVNVKTSVLPTGAATETTLNDVKTRLETLPAGTNDIGKVHIVNGSEEAGVHDKHLRVIGYYESIGHGISDPTTEIHRCMGVNNSIGTTGYALMEEFPFVQPTTDTQMYLQSSSASDSSAGTGVQQVTIEYFSFAWGDRKMITVTMNGTGQVTLPVADIYRVHHMYANRVGSAGVAVGNITLTNLATTTLYGEISATNAFMQRCIMYLGNGRKFTCTDLLVTCSTNGGVVGRLFASEEDESGNIVPRARLIFQLADNNIHIPFAMAETISNPNNKRISMGVAIVGKVANQSASSTMRGFEEDI